jgi:putative membrane protein
MFSFLDRVFSHHGRSNPGSLSDSRQHRALAIVVLAARFPFLLGEIAMNLIANILVALVAALHVYFLVLEMFLWTKPKGLKTFGNTIEKAQASAVLAANQGLYNGFLAAGLIWGLVHPNPAFGFQIKVFLLLCVIVAGLYGGYSVSKRIIMVQALPAAVALLLLWLARTAT